LLELIYFLNLLPPPPPQKKRKEKKKKIKKKYFLPLGFEPQPPECCLLITVQSTKQAGIFLGKCVQNATKTMVVDRKKKPEDTSSTVFEVWTALKYCELKYCADRVRSRSNNKDEVLNGKFSNLTFLPSTKKTTEYSFELFLSIYRHLVFFSVLNFTSLELNHFAK